MENKRRSQNSLNPKRGADFEKRVSKAASKLFRITFEKRPIKIGNPPKEHKFDLVSEDGKYIIECKKYSWTKSGYVPSAKMAFINEAVFYLLHLPRDKQRFVVLAKSVHQNRKETLAEYYFRTYRHLLNGIMILELDESTHRLSEVK